MRVGARRARRLRQRDEQRRLGVGEMCRLLAEPGQTARAHALEITAHRGQREVGGKDLALAQPPLELNRADHLDQLRAQGARARLEQAHDLHGECRSAGDDAAVRCHLGEGAEGRQGVDAEMVPEALVLDVYEEMQVVWRDTVGVGGEAPLLVARLERTQHDAMAILDDDGGCEPGEVGREGAVERDGDADEDRQGGESHKERPPASPSPACGRRWPDDVGSDEGVSRTTRGGRHRASRPAPLIRPRFAGPPSRASGRREGLRRFTGSCPWRVPARACTTSVPALPRA